MRKVSVSRANRMRSIALVFFLSMSLAGCTSLGPYRTVEGGEPGFCEPDKEGAVSEQCALFSTEVARNYELYIAEFDDQGRPFRGPKYPTPEGQVDRFLEAVRTKAGSSSAVTKEISDSPKAGTHNSGVSIVVFIHGWKHGAAYDDGNVKSIRRLLNQLSVVEDVTGCNRKVIGLYVGWRGDGTRLGEPFETATFWSRKLAASHVAEGGIQEVLSSLRAIQALSNANDAMSDKPDSSYSCNQRIRLTTVGHSFGALIAYSAISQSLVADMAQFREAGLSQTRLASNNDIEAVPSQTKLASNNDIKNRNLTVLINPAVESIRFDALMALAEKAKPQRYSPPILVAITSEDDFATRRLFPLGRTINTVTKQFPDDGGRGKEANRRTIGHDGPVITHTLFTINQSPTSDDSKHHGCNVTATMPYEERIKQDKVRAEAFKAQMGATANANSPGVFPRYFCTNMSENEEDGENVLVLRSAHKFTNLNSPIWNVKTRKPVVTDHNDFTNAKLMEFIRQLYADALLTY